MSVSWRLCPAKGRLRFAKKKIAYRWIDFLRSTTEFAIGFTTSTPPSRANLRRYHRHQGRYCRITNTNKTDPARLEARIYLALLGPIEQIV